MLSILESSQGDCAVLELTGRLDAKTSPELENKLAAHRARGKKIFLLDFTNLAYMSSAGLRVLVSAAQTAEDNGGQLMLSAMCSAVKEIFDVTGFSDLFQIYISKEKALQSLSEKIV